MEEVEEIIPCAPCTFYGHLGFVAGGVLTARDSQAFCFSLGRCVATPGLLFLEEQALAVFHGSMK